MEKPTLAQEILRPGENCRRPGSHSQWAPLRVRREARIHHFLDGRSPHEIGLVIAPGLDARDEAMVDVRCPGTAHRPPLELVDVLPAADLELVVRSVEVNDDGPFVAVDAQQE